MEDKIYTLLTKLYGEFSASSISQEENFNILLKKLDELSAIFEKVDGLSLKISGLENLINEKFGMLEQILQAGDIQRQDYRTEDIEFYGETKNSIENIETRLESIEQEVNSKLSETEFNEKIEELNQKVEDMESDFLYKFEEFLTNLQEQELSIKIFNKG